MTVSNPVAALKSYGAIGASMTGTRTHSGSGTASQNQGILLSFNLNALPGDVKIWHDEKRNKDDMFASVVTTPCAGGNCCHLEGQDEMVCSGSSVFITQPNSCKKGHIKMHFSLWRWCSCWNSCMASEICKNLHWSLGVLACILCGDLKWLQWALGICCWRRTRQQSLSSQKHGPASSGTKRHVSCRQLPEKIGSGQWWRWPWIGQRG